MAFEYALNVLAIVFFVMMFGGILLFVMGVSQGKNVRLGITLAVVGLLLGVITLIASQGVYFVSPTDRAVIFNSATGDLGTPLEPGVHIILPGIDETVTYNVASQSYSMMDDDAVLARSADGQNIFVDVTIIFNIDPNMVNQVHLAYSQLTGGYFNEIILPVVRNEVREVFATISAQDLYGNLEQTDAPVGEGVEGVQVTDISSLEIINDEIFTRIESTLAVQGFVVTQVLLRNINFSPEFVDAIERRQVAELERESARVEAETAQIEAEGRANARIEESRGEAEGIRVVAAAEAEALRLVSEQIASNPNLIQYTYINSLSDNVDLVIIPSNSPFLFDPSTFTDLGTGFTAPENEQP